MTQNTLFTHKPLNLDIFVTKQPITTQLVSLYSYPITNQGDDLGINHPLVPTYLVATKCLTCIPTYIVTTHIPSLVTYDIFIELLR
jgi:hypothetical protein